MAIETIDEGLALFGLNQLNADEIPQLALLFISSGCDVLEIAALAHPDPAEHPADVRRELERAIVLAGRTIPDRVSAARTLRRIYAQQGSLGKLSPRDAARTIKDVFHLIETELPKAHHYVGDSFDISAIIGLYYSYDDIPFDDTTSAEQIDLDLLKELVRLAADPTPLK